MQYSRTLLADCDMSVTHRCIRDLRPLLDDYPSRS
jgi:hypothetical protein